MSWQSSNEAGPSWREEVFQDAARIWSLERPSMRDLLGAFVKDSGMGAAFLFRLASRLLRQDHPLLSTLISRANLALHGCQIHPQAQVGPGLRLPHPTGLVVGRGVRAGRDLTLYQNVTLGAKSLSGDDYPTLGDGVFVFPNSVVLGSIRVGDGARVGACSVVLHEVDAGDTVAGAPAVSLHRPGSRPMPRSGREIP